MGTVALKHSTLSDAGRSGGNGCHEFESDVVHQEGNQYEKEKVDGERERGANRVEIGDADKI